MIRVVEAEEPVEPTPEESLTQRVRAFVRLKNTVKALTEEQNKARDELAAMVESAGETDSDGSQWLNLPSDVDGFSSLKRERRVSQSLDINAAETILRGKGLYERCIVQVPALNEDEVMHAFTQGLLTEEDLDVMFPKKITYAFLPSKKVF